VLAQGKGRGEEGLVVVLLVGLPFIDVGGFSLVVVGLFLLLFIDGCICCGFVFVCLL